MKKILITIILLAIIICFRVNAQTAYIANFGDNTVSVINVATNTISATIAVGTSPIGVSVSPDGSKVYVSNNNSNTISVINTATNTVSATITVGASPWGVFVSPDGSKVYVANDGNNTISVINTATNTISATIAVSSAPACVCVSPDGSKLYISDYTAASVSVINTTTNTVSNTISVGAYPFGITVSPDGSKVYVANRNSNTVSVINSTNNTVLSTITVGTSPYGVSVSPDGSKVYVTNNSDNTVNVINSANNTVTSTIRAGSGPYGVSVSPDGGKIYIANYAVDTVNVINSVTNIVSATIPVGNGPASLENFISINSIAPPLVSISASSDTICAGSSTTLTANGANTYSWSNGLGTSNPVTVMPTVTTTYTVSGTSAGGTDSSNITIYVNPNPTVGISASANAICAGTSATLTANGAATYSWNNSLGVANPVTVLPTVNTAYAVTATDTNGCTGTASITINIVTNEAPGICMVTTDSASNYQYNVVCWDKTSYNNADSFIVYRLDVVSSKYLRIGAVSVNSLSEFTDTASSIGGPNGGNPMYSSWFYKLAIRDTCGNIGEESPYHQSMFVQENGSNFSWNAYTVEAGQTNPVTGYSFLRDDNNTGNWHVLANTAGLSATDPNYSSYPNGNWRIDALGFNCAPTMKFTNTQAYLKSHSNTIKLVLTHIENLVSNNEQIAIYPNPANNNIIIENTFLTKDQIISVYNIQGQLLIQQPLLKAKTNVDISTFAKGVYFVKEKSENGIAVEKFVKE